MFASAMCVAGPIGVHTGMQLNPRPHRCVLHDNKVRICIDLWFGGTRACEASGWESSRARIGACRGRFLPPVSTFHGTLMTRLWNAHGTLVERLWNAHGIPVESSPRPWCRSVRHPRLRCLGQRCLTRDLFHQTLSRFYGIFRIRRTKSSLGFIPISLRRRPYRRSAAVYPEDLGEKSR